jgi:hypothetical protein
MEIVLFSNDLGYFIFVIAEWDQGCASIRGHTSS